MVESNGTAAKPSNPVAQVVNRKKQKRRAKQAARQAAVQDGRPAGTPHSPHTGVRNGHVAQNQSTLQHAHPHHQAGHSNLDYGDVEYDDDDQYEPEEILYYSEEDGQAYDPRYENTASDLNGQYTADYASANGTGKKTKKKRKSKSSTQSNPYASQTTSTTNLLRPSGTQVPPPPPPPPPPLSTAALRSVQRSAKDRIWNTSTQEERQRIKEFWLSLGEDERKSLVKIEKEAVLRKMKEQQKHSCSCTVCGRKRTAIEEELEVLYDAYYEELEQYANHQQDPEDATPMLPPRRFDQSHSGVSAPPVPQMMSNRRPIKGRIQEIPDNDADDDEEDEDEDGDEEEYSDGDDGYSDEDEAGNLGRGPAAEFFNFGNSLTVKGGILTVADDLLKNDGKKFIEMMEQLAERRMQREEEARYASAGVPHPMENAQGNNHGPFPEEEDDYDEDDDYDSQEDDYDEEEEETDTMTEEQRMEEGRRMFQIFAARMFEQRVLTAYREKVARERQQKLLEELEEESRLDVEREAKKARDAQKKKDKKQQQKQAKAEEKARREAEKAAEEAAAKQVEEKKQEEQRQKREEQRKKKEAERKAQEEERLKKEAEKQKRLQEERERQQEAERKVREQKALEKKAKEEARKKEKEQREAKEREAREKKAQEEKERKEREAKAKSGQEAKERAKKEQQPAQASQQAQAAPLKRPSAPTAISLPLGLHSKPSSTGFQSPHVPVAKPAIPKAPTPGKPRQNSQQGSHASSPKTPHAAPGSAKALSPKDTPAEQPHTIASKTILTNPQNHQVPPLQYTQPLSPTQTIPPPAGMAGPPMGGVPPAFQHNLPHIPQGLAQRGFVGHNMPYHSHQGPPIGGPFRGYGPPTTLMNQPPDMGGMGMIPHGRGFPLEAPPGFPHPGPGMGAAGMAPGFGMPKDALPPHSRNPSASHENPVFERPIAPPQTQPIARPAPIRRPSSVKPREGGHDSKLLANSDMDDLSNHLGSSALLADTDEPIPVSNADARRPSLAPGSTRTAASAFGSSPMFPEVDGQGRLDAFGRTPHTGPGSSWNTPTMPFGPPGVSGGPSWGTPAPGGWPAANTFGMMGGQSRPSISRPVSLRLMVCQACRQLTANGGGSDGFQDVANILRHVDAMRLANEPPAQIAEVLEICETEGNAHNGGGYFVIKRDGPDRTLVKYEADSNIPQPERPGAGVGEIGSPLQGHMFPTMGGSRPFPSLGGVSSPGF